MHRVSRFVGFVVLGLCASAPARAQSNSIPGTDIKLGALGNLKVWGRTGAFPTGTNGVSMSTTACNVGTQKVGWFAPMATDHPVISFIFVREENGRFEQISDRSYVKHGFFATNQSSCGQCPTPGGDSHHLLVGCSDTYDVNNNGDQYYLGPPTEVDPWLGKWTSQCSHFDRGEPPVPPPADCDNIRSFTSSQAQALGPVGHRVNLDDDDLNHPGANFWYQGMYVIAGEPEADRDNNMVSRQFTATWNGSAWAFAAVSGQTTGTILQRWSGATIASNTNGVDDGRVYVGVAVTGPTAGLYHYEYSIHNRDNARGVGGVHIPVSATAQVQNAGFHDFDHDATTDWTFTRTATEIVFDTPANPIEWNTIYSFRFDSDAAPQPGTLDLDEFHPGPGAASIAVASTAPLDVCPATTIYCTAKTTSLGCTPAIAAAGTASASVGSGFVISASNIVSSTNGLLFYGKSGPLAQPFQGGTLCVAPPHVRTGVQSSGGSPPNTDCSGAFSIDFNTWILFGNDPSLAAGLVVDAQYWGRDINDPTGFGSSLTDAVEFTICN
jgi:hypothetical protein